MNLFLKMKDVENKPIDFFRKGTAEIFIELNWTGKSVSDISD